MSMDQKAWVCDHGDVLQTDPQVQDPKKIFGKWKNWFDSPRKGKGSKMAKRSRRKRKVGTTFLDSQLTSEQMSRQCGPGFSMDWNWTENTEISLGFHTSVSGWFPTSMQDHSMGVSYLLTNAAEMLGVYLQMKLEPNLTPYSKINSRSIKVLSVPKTMKLREENIG